MVLQRDVPWTVRGASVYGNSFTTITDGFDNFDWTSFITGCDFPGGAFYLVPHVYSSNGTRCAYDFSLVASEDASTENKAFFASASHQMTDQWQIHADMLFSQAESFAQMAPVPDSSFFLNPLSVDSPNNPTNPNSPLFDPSLGLAPQAVNWWHRFDALGNRDTTIQTQLLDMHLSLAGKLGRFDFSSGIRHTDNRTADVTRNLLLRGAAHALVEDGSYDLANPYAASEATLNAMRFTQIRDARFDQDELYAQLETNLFSLPGGDTRVLLGASVMQE
jgi:iron complex outermembrane receptor protein